LNHIQRYKYDNEKWRNSSSKIMINLIQKSNPPFSNNKFIILNHLWQRFKIQGMLKMMIIPNNIAASFSTIIDK